MYCVLPKSRPRKDDQMTMSTDDAIHKIAKDLDEVRWRDCKDYGAFDGTFEWYYAESQLYVIRHKRLKHIYLIKAKSPADAMTRLKHIYES